MHQNKQKHGRNKMKLNPIVKFTWTLKILFTAAWVYCISEYVRVNCRESLLAIGEQ